MSSSLRGASVHIYLHPSSVYNLETNLNVAVDFVVYREIVHDGGAVMEYESSPASGLKRDIRQCSFGSREVECHGEVLQI